MASKIKGVSKQPDTRRPAADTTRPAPVFAQGKPVFPSYTEYRTGTAMYHIGNEGNCPGYFIPDEALDVFNDEYDYRETANSRDLTDMAVALFVGMLDVPAVPSGGGNLGC